jgi:hypothetical protein
MEATILEEKIQYIIWELLAIIRKGTCSPSSPIDDGNGIPVPSPS